MGVLLLDNTGATISVDEAIQETHKLAWEEYNNKILEELEDKSWQRLNWNLKNESNNGFNKAKTMRRIANIPPTIAGEMIMRFGKRVFQDKKLFKEAIKFYGEEGEKCLTVRKNTI